MVFETEQKTWKFCEKAQGQRANPASEAAIKKKK